MKRTPEYEFSVGLRLTHWIRAICIVVLVVTGFYISYVFIAPSVSSEPEFVCTFQILTLVGFLRRDSLSR